MYINPLLLIIIVLLVGIYFIIKKEKENQNEKVILDKRADYFYKEFQSDAKLLETLEKKVRLFMEPTRQVTLALCMAAICENEAGGVDSLLNQYDSAKKRMHEISDLIYRSDKKEVIEVLNVHETFSELDDIILGHVKEHSPRYIELNEPEKFRLLLEDLQGVSLAFLDFFKSTQEDLEDKTNINSDHFIKECGKMKETISHTEEKLSERYLSSS